MKILVLNCGSSSLKYKLFRTDSLELLAGGVAERLGQADNRLHRRWRDAKGVWHERDERDVCADHRSALERAFADLAAADVLRERGELLAVGHRVVHGGERFTAPARIDAATLAAIRALVPLAPLHNPANLLGIELAAELCGAVPQVAVFDTSFHHTLPPRAYRYALPDWTYRAHQVRRYGFHGTSVHYVGRRAAALLGRPFEQLNLIVLHLGHGTSITAVERGRSIDTSMGMTPLEGLVMGTRCGDLDPAVPFYLMREHGLDAAAMEHLLFFDSGLKGLCGAGDMREVHRRADGGDESAQLALDVTVYRLRQYIGAYAAALGRVDAIVFTAGIGENDAELRARVLDGLDAFGIAFDHQRNAAAAPRERAIGRADSTVALLVIPTDEEWEIARLTLETLQPAPTARSTP